MGVIANVLQYLRGGPAMPAMAETPTNATSGRDNAPDLADQTAVISDEELDEYERWEAEQERDRPTFEPKLPIPPLGQCPTLDIIVARGMQRMTHYVPRELTPPEMLQHADDLDREAAIEGGWDNYSTAAHLRGSAEAHRLAAALTSWEAPQAPALQARHNIATHLRDVQVLGLEQDEDVSEHTHAHRSTMNHAIGQIEPSEMGKLIDELAAAECLGAVDLDALKVWHRDAAEREAAQIEQWKREEARDLDRDDDLGN